MKTADLLLTTLITNHEKDLQKSLPYKDTRILLSLAKSVSSDSFITENQSKLLIKIFKENQSVLKQYDADFLTIVDMPTWGSPFRQVEITKKIYSCKISDDAEVIAIEFSFSASIRKKVMSLGKVVTGLVQAQSGKLFYIDYSEKNIIAIIDELKEFNFSVEEKLKNFYDTIKSWNVEDVKNQFVLTNITHDNFRKQITADLGINTSLDDSIIADRSMRYQYIHENIQKNPENLTEKLAFRKSTKVWVDRNSNSLSDIIQSLQDLRRLPTLLVFDAFDTKSCAQEMRKISEILEENGIYDNVGIYFRLHNDENGKEFNQLIQDKKYNSQLSTETKIVGVQSGKIPKFLLKNDWKPMSVITIGNSLRHSKTAVYASCCDLIIAYTDKEPIIEQKAIWE